MGKPEARPASIAQLFCLLLIIPAVSALVACVLAPWLPFSWTKIFRRVATIAAGVALVWLVRRDPRARLRWLGLEFSGRWGRELCLGGGVATAAYMTLLWLGALTGVVQVGWSADARWVGLALIMLPTALLIGCLEELFFRGWLFQAFRSAWGVGAAVIGSSLLYASLHLVKDLAQLASKWPDFIGLFLLGLLCVSTRVVTGRLFVSIGLHSMLVYLIKLDGAWLRFHEREPHWVYGTPQLLINGLLGWVTLAMVGVVTWRWLQGGSQMVGRRKAQAIVVASLVMGLVGLAAVARAEEPAAKQDPSRYHGMARKLGRGVANVATGVLEIPRQMAHTIEQDGIIAGLTVGTVKGVGWAVSRELVGIYEVATFIMPQPDEYGVILEPEFVYNHWEWQ